MKKLTAVLIVILYIILGRYLITLDEENVIVRIALNIYSGVSLIFFTYGVYKLITRDEK